MLSRCIAVDPQSFASEYWGIRPLLSTSEALPRDFCDLLSPAAVDELLAERGVRAPFIRLAKEGELLAKDSYLGSAGFGAEVTDQVDSTKVLAEFAAGATVVLQGLHRLWPPLIEFVRGVVDDIGHPVQANAYITPPNNRGFDFHYDVHDVFVLQVSGTKRWTVREPVHRHPVPSQPWTGYRDQIAAQADAEPVIDTVLEAGDALYLPRGWVHAAQALDTTSIHLTIGVSATTGLDVARAVVDQLAQLETFRAPLPMAADPTVQMATVSKVVAQMVTALRDDAAAVSAGAAEALTSQFAKRTRPEPVRPLAMLEAAVNAARITVRWRRGLMAALESDGDDRVAVRLPDKVISFPASCSEPLRWLHTGEVGNAERLPGLDVQDGAVLIRRLLREGVVVPAVDAPSAERR